VATERWNDERLDRLAESVETNTANIARLASIIETQQDTMNQGFKMLIQEIRGLRSENRRILTHLFGDQPE
jgi:hypothetical protein